MPHNLENLFSRKLQVFLLFITLLCASTVFAEPQQKPKFGVSIPLSGILAEYGVAVRNGILLAQEDYPENFKNIELVYEDSQWDPKTAIAAFNKLKNIHKADLIFNWGNPTSEAVAPLAERSKTPTLLMSSDHKVALNKEYLIRTVPAGILIGKKLADHLRTTNYKNFAVVMSENSYVQSLYEGLSNALTKSDIKLDLISQVALNEQDFKSTISRIKQKNYDAVIVFLISGQVQTFFQQAAAQNLSLPAFGADFFGSKTEIAAAGPKIEGSIFPDLGVTDEFRARYLKQFGNDIQIAFAANAYDVASQVFLTLGTNGDSPKTAELLLDKLKQPANFASAHGFFKFKSTAEFGPAYETSLILRKVTAGDIINLRN